MKMKNTFFLILSLFISTIYAQTISDKEIKTEVSEVTVFIENAQVTRKTSQMVAKGKSNLKFINLSPFIDAKSIQVRASGLVTVLSVNHQQNFIDKLEKQQEVIDLETKFNTIGEKIKLEQTYLSILKEELAFLKENRDIGGKNQQVSVLNLKDASNFYGSKLTSLKLKEIERNKTLQELNKQQNDLRNQLNTLRSKKEFPNGEIVVKVDAKNTTKVIFELSYVVNNAGWFPSYDIRAKNINEPVELVYKANVKQDTKVEWKNVKLKLSSAEPNISGVIPELQTYFLNYNSSPPIYGKRINQVTGTIFDSNRRPLPGVNVVVDGTTIGTSTDFNGKYNISIPNNATNLNYSFVGFQDQSLPIRSSVMNVYLQEDAVLDEVVVTGYAEEIAESRIARTLQKKSDAIKIRGAASLAIPTTQIENQTSVDFEIKIPYTVKSDNKSYVVDIDVYKLPAFYQYYSVPKVDKTAFLTANITDWEKYYLLEGEANIFFEGTFVGKSLLDVRYASDTLQISLGRDKNVSVTREKIKDFTSKKFIGSKKEEARAWDIIVKNNKSQPINMVVYDQVPVSTLDEIKVEISKISGAKKNPTTGELKWEFKLDPKKSKEFKLQYSVKYPKNRNLIIE
jgi:hypothetical protein